MAVASLLAGVTGASVAAVPLPSGEIVFTRQAGANGHPDLYVMRPDGTHVRLLMRNASDAAVSRDGRWIAFVRNTAIWVASPDGSSPREVTRPPNKVFDVEPAWSADAKTLFFSRVKPPENGYQSIFATSVDGSRLRRLTTWDQSCDTRDMAPAPSPDGRIVAYVHYCDRGGRSRILVMTPDGGDAPENFRHDTFCYKYSPAWSPDGTSLAFAGERCMDDMPPPDFGSRLAIYVTSTKRAERLIARPGETGCLDEPAWSPDGRWIVYTRALDDSWKVTQLWLVRTDGTGLRRLTDGTPADWSPAWLPQKQ